MREHNFVGEQRSPLKSVSSVCIGSANQFVLAIAEFNEFSATELLDHLLVMALWNQIFQFHTPQLYGSGLDIG